VLLGKSSAKLGSLGTIKKMESAEVEERFDYQIIEEIGEG